MDLRVGNRARVVALAVGTYELTLPNGLILNLQNYYYMPTMCRNIISVSCLEKKSFEFIIQNNKCNIYHDNIFYGYAPRTSGLYVLNVEDTSEKSIYNIESKYLLLRMEYFWKHNLFTKELMGAKCNLKKFKTYKLALY